MKWAVLLLALTGCTPADVLNDTIGASGLTITHEAYMPGPRGGADVYRAAAPPPGPVAAPPLGLAPLIVFIYGGGWRSGDKGDYRFAAAPLAQRGAVVVVPDYRVYPDAAFPRFLQDNAAAVAWARAHAADWGANPARTYLVGHSAGAYNVAMLALDPRWLRAAGASRDDLAGVVAMAGPFDFLPITDPDVIPIFAPVQDGPLSQPIHFVDGRNPPMLLLAGDADVTVNPANTRSLARAVRAAGGPVDSRIYPGLGHIGLVTALAPLFQRRAPVLDDIWSFIQSTPARADAGGRPG